MLTFSMIIKQKTIKKNKKQQKNKMKRLELLILIMEKLLIIYILL